MENPSRETIESMSEFQIYLRKPVDSQKNINLSNKEENRSLGKLSNFQKKKVNLKKMAIIHTAKTCNFIMV